MRKICRGCGCEYECTAGQDYICTYCGTRETVSLGEDAESILKNALARRRECAFNAARREYEYLLKKEPALAIAHFGRFLAEYEVFGEERFLAGERDAIKCFSCKKTSALQDPSLMNALENCGSIGAKWRELAAEIDSRRALNSALLDIIESNNYTALLIADGEDACALNAGKEIFDKLKDRIDVCYPQITMKHLTERQRDAAITVALDNVPMLFFVCTDLTDISEKMRGYADRFLESWDSKYICPILIDGTEPPEWLEYGGRTVDFSENTEDGLIKFVSLFAGLSMNERIALMKNGAFIRNSADPSPEILL